MKQAPRFKGIVTDDASMKANNPTRLRDYLRSLKPGRDIWLTIEIATNKRTLSQNNYYWAYLNIIADETGDDANSIHEWAKRKFLSPKFITVQGEEIKIPASTTDLSKPEFSEYLMRISTKTNVPLPDPDELGYIKN